MIRRSMPLLIALGCVVVLTGCNLPLSDSAQSNPTDHSGTYCLNVMNLELTLTQTGESLVFTTSSDALQNGSGTVSGSEMQLSAATAGGETFSASVTFAEGGSDFRGRFEVINAEMQQALGGVLLGFEGPCPNFDLDAHPLPQFITHDFINLAEIDQISRFRSGFGHSFTDDFETCRSMKHYYNPLPEYLDNHLVEIYAPVEGTILVVLEDGHGASLGLNNKQIHIRPDAQPAFTIELFHVDLVSGEIIAGKQVEAGELLGYARLYYEDLDEHATSIDIAVRVNTPTGSRLVSYFDVMTKEVFESYLNRGILDRQDFIISLQERDAAPLVCSGEAFESGGELENWVRLP